MNQLKLPEMTYRKPELSDLSPELLCEIFQCLTLKEVLYFSMLSRKMLFAVDLHLRLRKSIDFCESKVLAFMPSTVTDDTMHSLLKKCPQLEVVYGLNPLHVERRRLRKRSSLTVPGIINALSICPCLKAIETSDLKLLEAIMQQLPQLEIIGRVQNRDAHFPPQASQRFKLQPYPKITTLNLMGVEVPELTAMPHLQHLFLQCVRFTKLQPFRAFIAHNLQTFVMKHCIGPSLSLRYLSLIIALSSSPCLRRLELVRVPLPSGLLQRAVEDSYRHNGFVNLTSLVISGCKGILETDIGHLLIVSSQNMEQLYIQPSLTKDSLFVSLSFAQCSFPKLKTLYLGYVDEFNTGGEYSNEALLNYGLAEVPDTPASLTDSGMKVIGELFPGLETLSVTNCPHLISMDQWSEGETQWQHLLDLTLQRCHCLRLSSFASFISTLPKIEVIILVDMFREPPKGCSHVGLSAGTGLGMSSAVVSNQDEHIAVQGHQQDFELPADENVPDNEDIDPFPHEPHLIVLERDLFDEQDLDFIEERIPELENIINPIDNNVRNDVEDHSSDQNENKVSVAVNKPEELSLEDDNISLVGPKVVEYNTSESSDSEMNQKAKRKKKDAIQILSAPQDCKCCDPNQPSTSTATCRHNFNASDESLGNRIKTECISDGKVFEDELVGTPSHLTLNSEATDPKGLSVKIKQENFSDEEKEPDTACLKTDAEKHFERNNLYVGPMTRHRRKILADEAEMEQLTNSKKKFRGLKKNKRKVIVHGSKALTVDDLQPTLCLHRVSVEDENFSTAPTECENGNLNCKDSTPSVINASNSHAPKNEASIDMKDKVQQSSKCSTKPFRHLCKSPAKIKELENRRASVAANQQNHHNEISVTSQGTQATSEDIKHCIKRMKNQKKDSEKSGRNKRKKSSSHLKYSAISRRVTHKRKRSASSSIKENKATSTSDPLLEEDAVQVLRLASETLHSLTIVSCGLSDIIINRSNQLRHVEVQACRILKSCEIYYCPSLRHLNISQCPKLSFESVFPFILELETHGHLMMSFEPWNKNYDPGDTESALFYAANLDQNIILCEDYTESPEEANQFFLKNRLFAWMESLDSLVPLFGFNRKEPKLKFKSEDPLTFPWCHDLRRVVGFPKPERSILSANLGVLCDDLIKVQRLQRTIKAFYISVDKYPEDI
ncbi:F-box only protein 38-like isoform X2 [Uloborus diversus]|uniref:F-box only protein 38-like isoform X2 n=1 Tax=Uloborus diversus TaxID=327109 RepID=UPI0024090AFB|nr:F-box only protein 38-like isoform X2 [Uloborus diversus]